MTIPKVEIAVDGKCPYCQVPVGGMEIHLCSEPGTDENESLRRMLSEAAREINCAGPVAHRIRILKKEHAAQLAAARQEAWDEGYYAAEQDATGAKQFSTNPYLPPDKKEGTS